MADQGSLVAIVSGLHAIATVVIPMVNAIVNIIATAADVVKATVTIVVVAVRVYA